MDLSTIQHRLFTLAQNVHPVGHARVMAAVVRKGKIISVACNERKSDPRQAGYERECKCGHTRAVHNGEWGPCELCMCRDFSPRRIYRHAEMSAIKRAQRQLGDLRGCVLVVARAKKVPIVITSWDDRTQEKDGWAPGNSKPCSACQEYIKDVGIEEVCHT